MRAMRRGVAAGIIPVMSKKKSGLLATWFVAGLAVMATGWLLPGVHVGGFVDALLAAAVIGLVNALVRPILVLLTLPVTVVTLGLFLLVVNGLMLQLADALLRGFAVDGLLWSVLGSVVLSVVTSILSGVLLKK